MVLLISVKNKRKKERKKEGRVWNRWCDLVVSKKVSENKREKKCGFEKAMIGNQEKEKTRWKLKESKRKFERRFEKEF